MSDNKKVVIDFGTDGSWKIEAFGYKGRACEEATLPFERALGGADKTERKPEWHEERPVAEARKEEA